jgi:hypothetical protein
MYQNFLLFHIYMKLGGRCQAQAFKITMPFGHI